MSNKNLFTTSRGPLLPSADTRNEAGGAAYALSAEHALAQYAATGCFNRTFYAGAGEQLDKVLSLALQADPGFVARTAVFSRSRGYMKDMPSALCAVLARRDMTLCARVFDRVIDNGTMLRNFVQIVRSGVTGRKSLGTAPKRLIAQWLDKRSDEAVFRASVGADPSLADVIKMVHPKPSTLSRQALYAYLIDKPYDAGNLPLSVRMYKDLKAGRTKNVPDVPFQLLTSLPLGKEAWTSIARNASWHMTRMNLNTFARHGVFTDKKLADTIAARLRNPELIRKAKVFPYQLMTAYVNTGADIPLQIREALQDAMECAIENVPELTGTVYVCPDVSGSMRSPVTGYRKGSTTAVSCLDVASLIAAAIVRKNPSAEVIPFSDDVVPVKINPRDSVMTNARILASLPSGGTKCSAPLEMLNARGKKGDMVIMISDNESWKESRIGTLLGQASATMRQWSTFKNRNAHAKLVCIDLQPYDTTQAQERHDIMNIGGFSDQVFDLIAAFHDGTLSAGHWVDVISKVEI